jgi:hypothetical protein
MKFSVPFGYDAVGKVDREFHDGHNYRVEWHEIDIEVVEPVDAPIATRWSSGETVFLNGRHYARLSHVTRPYWSPPTPWLPDIGPSDFHALKDADLSSRSKIPALDVLISALSPRQTSAFYEFNVKRREKRPPQFIWTNADKRRAEIDKKAQEFLIIDEKVLIATKEPVYRLSSVRNTTKIDVILNSPTANDIRRDPEKFNFFRADRFEDAIELARRWSRNGELSVCTPIEVLIPNSIKALDDLQAILDAAHEALKIGESLVLSCMSTDQAMTWFQLRDATRFSLKQLNDNDLLSERLSAYIAMLRSFPGNWNKQLESICQQLERWQMRPITSVRGR